MDIATLRILEDYLDNFAGIVIVVSHDRYFLDRTVRRIFVFEENGRLVQHEGGYTDYANRKAAEEEASAPKVVQESSENKGKNWKEGQKKRLKFSYEEQRDYEKIESEIATLEQKIEALNAEYMKYSNDFVKLNEIAKEKEQAESLLEEKMDRWMYLEGLAERIEKGELV